MKRLDGTVGFVTGASSGLGRAVCIELVRRGSRVAMVARRGDRLLELEKRLGSAALALTADVRRETEMRGAAAAALDRFGRIDFSLANAGFGVGRTVDRLTVEDFRRQFETNVFGVLQTLYATLPALKESRGVFAVTGSVTGYLSAPGSVAYATSKFAVRGLAQGLRAELAASGVAVVLLTPGFVESEIRRVDNAGRFRPEFRDTVPPWLQLSAERAARSIVSAVVHRRGEAVITLHGRVAVLLARHCPRSTAFLLARAARRDGR